MLDVARAARAAARVGPVRLEAGIAGARRALLRALAGDDEHAPPDGQVGRDLRKAQAPSWRSLAAHGDGATVRRLEPDRGGRRAVAQHLAQQAGVTGQSMNAGPWPSTSWWCGSIRAGSAPASITAIRLAMESLPPEVKTRT